jgi:AraC family transcriptional regulator
MLYEGNTRRAEASSVPTPRYDTEHGSSRIGQTISLSPASKLGTGRVHPVRLTPRGRLDRDGHRSASCSTWDNGPPASNVWPDAHQPDSLESSSHPQSSVQQVRSVMAGLLTSLRVAINDERGSPEECLRRALAILQAVEERRQQSRLYVRGGLAPWQVHKVASYIETNLCSPIRIETLANIARLSRAHFSRSFRKNFRDSPIKYIIRRRIERAQELMLSTNASLSQITHDCGFGDQAYLCRLFRRFVGESPGTWRRAHVDAAGSSPHNHPEPAT